MGDPVLEVEGLVQALGRVTRDSSGGEGRRDGSSREQAAGVAGRKPRPGTEVAKVPSPSEGPWAPEGEQHSSEHPIQGTFPRGAAPQKTPSPGPLRELGRGPSCEWDGFSC